MREYWYFLPLIGVIFILLSFQVSDYTINDYSEIPNKISDISNIQNIEINGINISIKFDSETNKLFYSEKINAKVKNDTLVLDGSKIKKNLEIVIGTKSKLNRINIDGVNININGNLNSNELGIDGINVIFNENFKFEGDSIKLEGTNVIIRGYLKGKVFKSESVSNNLDITVENFEKMFLEGINIKVDIKYLDTWNDTREIFLDSISTNITVYIRNENKGILNSNKSIKIIYY
ncbi:hypothetical protein [Marinitoga litoralis]|uniref:hypothetical protein n=1 Tax=Marinitoga litoralis TaxID=570855 RepID=UPI001960A2E4|nr:hypothetical protein [Marinitoga litoralis]MBM7558529.1 hypothetical protein [Marinitoga litoralis]